MNKLSWLPLLFFILSFQAALSQQIVTARISTEIVPPIMVVENLRMRFGAFSVNDNQSSVTLSTSNERIALGNIKLFDSQFNAGKFTIFSTPGSLVTLTLPKKCIRFSLENGRYCFALNSFKSNIPDSGILICPLSGKTEVNIGATLHSVAKSDGNSGMNRGTYDVVFTYN